MEELVKYAVYGIMAVVGWFVRILWDAQKEMRDDLKKIELDIAANYTKRSDFKDVISELKDEMREVTAPLFKKLDKIEEYFIHMNRENK